MNRPGVQREPDYRFTLANERTFLAYVRTALALDAAGLAVEQFLKPTHDHVRLGLAIVLVVLGTAVAAFAQRRWYLIEQAMRQEKPLPATPLPGLLTAGMIVVSVTALVLVLMHR